MIIAPPHPPPTPYRLQLWADSFHEGQWACEQLAHVAVKQGASHSVRFDHGYQPVHEITHRTWSIEITVFGDYDAWDRQPAAVAKLISWGKPDLIAFDEATQRVLFAVEESAATPTGNQATQRCERQFGAAHERIPFWYLLSEFGVHLDGGVRRDSIWPTVMALKITQDRHLPSVVLHYSDLDNPEDYSAGGGLEALFTGLHHALHNAALGKPILHDLATHLTAQYENMIDFLRRQWNNQIDFLPGRNALDDIDLPAQYAYAAVGSTEATETLWDAQFLRWPRTTGVPQTNRDAQVARPLIKHDALAAEMEADIGRGRAYGLSSRAGSRPQPASQVEFWLRQQLLAFGRAKPLTPPATPSLSIEDFPQSQSGLLHLTTSRRITFLYDSWSDLSETLVRTFPRLSERLPEFDGSSPVLVYVSNSLKPGRIFGDPFTGQIAAYATAFGKWDSEPRRILTYFPHQTHAQALAGAQRTHNKGITIIQELVDLAIFAGGVAYRPGTGEVI